MLGATSALLAESLDLARRGGLDMRTVMEVVAESAVGSPLIQYKRAAVVSGDFTAAFSVSQMLKDFELIAEAAAGDATATCRSSTASARHTAPRSRAGLATRFLRADREDATASDPRHAPQWNEQILKMKKYPVARRERRG